MPKINRLKVILSEKEFKAKELADHLGVDRTTVCKWCSNSSQPDVLTVFKIAQFLDIEIKSFFDEEFVNEFSVWGNNEN